MLAKFLFTTLPGSILLGAMIVSSAILVSGGDLKIKGETQKNNNIVVQVAAP